MKLRLLLAALCAVLFASNADARPVNKQAEAGCSDPVMRPCYQSAEKYNSKYNRSGHRIGSAREFALLPDFPAIKRMGNGLRRVMAEGAGRVVGGRPAGCPRHYCGCGASLYLFGKISPALNLAANWLHFPRAAPAPGMVAARRGHVFVLKRHIRGKVWMVHDSNSGRGKTRVHPRSIAGFQVVDPRGV